MSSIVFKDKKFNGIVSYGNPIKYEHSVYGYLVHGDIGLDDVEFIFKVNNNELSIEIEKSSLSFISPSQSTIILNEVYKNITQSVNLKDKTHYLYLDDEHSIECEEI